MMKETMMKYCMLRVVVILLLVQFLHGVVMAGRGDKSGTSAAPELLIPVGARALALGSSSISSVSGIEAIYWNPAGLARSPHAASAMFSHMNYIADVGVDYGAVSIAFPEFGTLGMSLKSLSFGEIPITTEDQPDGTGEIASTTFITLGMTYSRQLADRISVGFTMNYIAERMERVSASGIAFNIGVQYNNVGSIEGLTLGVVVKNFGPQMQFHGSGLLRSGQVDGVTRSGSFYEVKASSAELPSTMELGIGYLAKVDENNKVNVTTSFQNNNFSDDEFRVGGEYSYNDMFFLRAGFSGSSQTIQTPDNASDYIFGSTIGAGVRTVLSDVDVSIDYVYRTAMYFSGNHVVAITAGF